MSLHNIQGFKNKIEGRTVFILGGGASVTSDILSILNNTDKVFCLNSSIKFINNPLAVLWCDHGWIAEDKNFKMAKEKTNYRFFVKDNGQIDKISFCDSITIKKTGNFGYDSSNIQYVRGNNSGAYSINLLVNCKVSKIILVGFDMKIEKNKSHFHNEYSYPIRHDTYTSLFIPSIESMANELKKIGSEVKIYNTNEYSNLKCFEYKSLEEFL